MIECPFCGEKFDKYLSLFYHAVNTHRRDIHNFNFKRIFKNLNNYDIKTRKKAALVVIVHPNKRKTWRYKDLAWAILKDRPGFCMLCGGKLKFYSKERKFICEQCGAELRTNGKFISVVKEIDGMRITMLFEVEKIIKEELGVV